MKVLVYIVPGLGQEDASKPPQWVNDLKASVCAVSPDVVAYNASYTDGRLPEDIAERITQLASECGQCKIVFIGHSDGGADGAWAQDHAWRYKLGLVFDLMIFLDPVTDLLRHGFLADLHPETVKDAARIYQTADVFIHSNRLSFVGGIPSVTEVTMAMLGQPFATHNDVSTSPKVHEYIANCIRLSVTAPPGDAAPVSHP